MKVILFANGWVGWKIAELLRDREEIGAVVVHPEANARLRTEILNACPDSAVVVEGDRLRKGEVLEQLAALGAEIGVSANFGYILRPNLFENLPRGCINVHSGYLPYNRGANPNVWSIVERTPAGVTIHHIDKGIDTGDIITREEVAIEATDTGGTLYEKLQVASVRLFEATWPAVAAGSAPRTPQDLSQGSAHRRADLARLDVVDLDEHYRAGDLIDIIRARTFRGFRGATFKRDGRTVSVELVLGYVEKDE